MKPLGRSGVGRHWFDLRRNRGTATIELLFVAPLLLLLMFGTSEFGHYLQQYEVLNKGVRNGARYAAEHATVGGLSNPVLTQAKKDEIARVTVYGYNGTNGSTLLPGLGTGDVTVDQPATNHIRVTVTYHYNPLWFGGIPGFFGNNIVLPNNMTASTTMRFLR